MRFYRIPMIGFFIGILLVNLLACSPSQENPSKPTYTPFPFSSWTIELIRSGGFAGRIDTLTVTSEGALAVLSENPPDEVHLILPAEETARLESLLRTASPFFDGRDRSEDCRDCFLYTLTAQLDGQVYTASMDDLTIDENLGPLLEALLTLMDAYLQD